MEPKRNTGVLVLIVILLIIMAPLSILSVYFKFINPIDTKPKEEPKTDPVVDKNPDNSKYLDGKLYFYNDKKELLGEYTCQKDPCSYAVSVIDDEKYSIDYLENEASDINVILNRYAFINDNDSILLYDLTTKEVLSTYKAVKNYHNMISPEIMLVQNNENKWGIIKLGDTVETIKDFEYDFIGLTNSLTEDNLIDTSHFVVSVGNLWGIIDNVGDLMSNYLAGEITSYNDILISLKNDNLYYLYDYNGKRVVDENGFNYISFTDKYINIVDKNNNLYVYDYVNDKKISSNIKLDGDNYKESFKSTFNQETNAIDILVGEKTYNFNI